jgi:DivIVA domain-containing protein
VQTLLIYLVVLAALVALLFAVVWFVFGRSEDLPPLEPDTTLTRLPVEGVTGHDVRALRFQLVARGYKQAEVDWALEKLAREIDELRAVVHRLQARESGAGSDANGPV